jgi:hypothetical protein
MAVGARLAMRRTIGVRLAMRRMIGARLAIRKMIGARLAMRKMIEAKLAMKTIWYHHYHNQLYQLIQLLKMQILSILMMRYIIRLQLYIDFLNFRATKTMQLRSLKVDNLLSLDNSLSPTKGKGPFRSEVNSNY